MSLPGVEGQSIAWDLTAHQPTRWAIKRSTKQVLQFSALATVRGVLVFIAGVTLVVSGRYPEPLFELTVGIERWTYRVVAYASLMTDLYPPFRLDVAMTSGAVPNAR